MHSSDLHDEAETLLGEDGPSTEAFLNLTHAQRIAVLMLSRGAKHTEIAIELKRSVRTLQYWMVSPDFRQALHEATSALLKEASALLHSKLGKAIDRLERIAQDPSEPASARVAANKALVTLALRMDNTVERDEQIQCLREEHQKVLAALQAQKPAPTCKITKKRAIRIGRRRSLPSVPSVPSVPPSPEVPSVQYVSSVPSAPYATASAEASHPVQMLPPDSAFGSLPSFASFPPHEPHHKSKENPTTDNSA